MRWVNAPTCSRQRLRQLSGLKWIRAKFAYIIGSQWIDRDIIIVSVNALSEAVIMISSAFLGSLRVYSLFDFYVK